MRLTPLPSLFFALLFALLAPGLLPARAVEVPISPPPGTTPGTPGPISPVPIPVFPLTRVVPKGEARNIAFFSYLYPDCASQGPVVARILEPPRHGTISFATIDSFPRYAAGSPLAPCITKKVPGLRMTYETEDNFEGFDTSRILLINPDGTAAEYEVKIWIR